MPFLKAVLYDFYLHFDNTKFSSLLGLPLCTLLYYFIPCKCEVSFIVGANILVQRIPHAHDS